MTQPELVCCKLCARVGRRDAIGNNALRSGYGEDAWLCVHRGSCNKRIGRRRRTTGGKWRGLSVRQAQALAWLFMVGKATPSTLKRHGFTEQTMRSLVNWKVASSIRTYAGPDSFTTYYPAGRP
jgi:hypothetical protein